MKTTTIAFSLLLLIQTELFANSLIQPVIVAASFPNTNTYDRFLWLGDISEPDRTTFLRILNGHLHALSRKQKHYFPVIVCKDFSLVKIDISNYGWKTETWEQLAKVEPFFHFHYPDQLSVVTKEWPGGIWHQSEGGDGKNYERGPYQDKTIVKGYSVPNPFLPQEELQHLYKVTASQVPIVSARWFIWQTGIQTKRSPGYYDFLQFNTIDDYFTLVGFDPKFAQKAQRPELLEAVVYSQISQQPRGVKISSALEFKEYCTLDSEEAINEKDPTITLDPKFFKHEAEERFGRLHSGMLGWFLNDAINNKRQDSAPDKIGSDNLNFYTNDKRIHAGISCYGCHYTKSMGGVNGIISFKEHFRSMRARGLSPASPLYKEIFRLEEQYGPSISIAMERDRAYHALAVVSITGMMPDVWAKGYYETFHQYNHSATLEEAAFYVGADLEMFFGALADYGAKTNGLHPTLAIFVSAKGATVPRKQYLNVIPILFETYYLMKGYKDAAEIPKSPINAGNWLTNFSGEQTIRPALPSK